MLDGVLSVLRLVCFSLFLQKYSAYIWPNNSNFVSSDHMMVDEKLGSCFRASRSFFMSSGVFRGHVQVNLLCARLAQCWTVTPSSLSGQAFQLEPWLSWSGVVVDLTADFPGKFRGDLTLPATPTEVMFEAVIIILQVLMTSICDILYLG